MEGGVWGVVIVTSAFLIQVLVFGLSSSIGIYNIEFLHHFHHDTVGVSLIAAINWATFLGSGPLASFLMSKLSHRKVALCGSVLVVVGVGLMPLLPYIPAYCVCFGLMAGVGSCLVYVPSHVLTGQYYQRHQSLATGVATSGSGFGGAVMPIALGCLIDRYGWRGSLLIVAGLQLHLFVLSALLRPPPAAGKEDDETTTGDDAASTLLHGSGQSDVCQAVTVHGALDVLKPPTTVDREDEKTASEEALALLHGSGQSDVCQAVTVHGTLDVLKSPTTVDREGEKTASKEATALREGSSHSEEYTKDSEAVTLTTNGCLSNNHGSAVVCETVTVHGTLDVLASPTSVDRKDERSTGEDALARLNCSSQSDDCQAVTVHGTLDVLKSPPGVEREDEKTASEEALALLDGSGQSDDCQAVTVHGTLDVLKSPTTVDREGEKTASEEALALLDGSGQSDVCQAMTVHGTLDVLKPPTTVDREGEKTASEEATALRDGYSHIEEHTDVSEAVTLTTNGCLSNNHGSAVVCEAVTVHGTLDVLKSPPSVDREDERSTGEDALARLNCSSQSDDCEAVTVHGTLDVLKSPPGVDREDERTDSYKTKALLNGSRNTVTVHSGNVVVLRPSPAVDRDDEKTASEEDTALLDGSSHTEKHTEVCEAETLTENGSLSNNHVAFSSLEPAPTTNGYLSNDTHHNGWDACRRSSPASKPPESPSREGEATALRHIYVFTHAGFDVYFLSHILWNAGGAVLMALGPDFIVEHGISSMDAAWLLTIFGLGNFVGGVLGGVLGNAWPRVRRGQYMVANVVFGVCVLACPWAATFEQFAGVLVCGGLAFGVVLGLLVVLLIDLIGDRNLANGLGYLMLADGVGAFAGPAFTGYIRKVTGSYNAALYCGGVMGVLAGVCMWLIPLYITSLVGEEHREPTLR